MKTEKKISSSRFEHFGMAALLPGMQYMLEQMEETLNAMRETIRATQRQFVFTPPPPPPTFAGSVDTPEARVEAAPPAKRGRAVKPKLSAVAETTSSSQRAYWAKMTP
jgi:hypothetical protein